MTRGVRAAVALAVAACAVVAGCSSGSGASDVDARGGTGGGSGGSLTLYTCVTDTTEQAVIAQFGKAHPGSNVNVFRAPTGQLNARVAADVRSGGLRADVIWACDPLTMHGYDTQGLVAAWTPPTASDIDQQYRSPHYTGVDLLYLVVVVHQGVPAPATWSDLTGPAYRGALAIPSPTFAASALGMLGYFAATPGYGLDFYRALKANGAKQVNSPTQVLTGVAQGTYRAGITIASSAYAAQQKGSPIQIVWPKPGAVAIYAPIAVTTRTHLSPLARPFVDYVASRNGQSVVAAHGAYPVRPGLGGPPMPAGSPVVSPPWPQLYGRTEQLLARYATIYPS